MTPEQERAYEIGIEALKSYETPQYGDLRLNAARASAKVVMALGEGGLILVARDDLAETVKDAHTFNDVMLGGDDAATARLDRLQAALSGTLHPPQSPESVSAPPATPGHTGTPPNPPSTRTSPHMSDTDHTRNPRNEDN